MGETAGSPAGEAVGSSMGEAVGLSIMGEGAGGNSEARPSSVDEAVGAAPSGLAAIKTRREEKEKQPFIWLLPPPALLKRAQRQPMAEMREKGASTAVCLLTKPGSGNWGHGTCP